eukprot:8759405-Prorocentrum_lima.AAC.1
MIERPVDFRPRNLRRKARLHERVVVGAPCVAPSLAGRVSSAQGALAFPKRLPRVVGIAVP